MSDGNLVVVKRLYDALKARDAQAIEQVFAPDVEIFQTPELPWRGHHQGRDGRIVRFSAYIDAPARLAALGQP